jgi:pimeloyl-ACP methyl ester carboxylesterase
MKDKSHAKKIVASDGLNIYYWVTWNNQLRGNFRVLHPGASMNHSSLEPLEKGLNERGYATVGFDPRGVGYSDKPTESDFYALERYSSDLQRIIEKEGLENPALLGHSLGFMPAVDYTSRTLNAERIIGICGSHNFKETAGNETLFHLFDKFLRYLEYPASLGMRLAHTFRGEKRQYQDQSELQHLSEFGIWLSIADVALKSIKTHTVSGKKINTFDITKQLISIDKPFLLIYGSEDPMVRPIAGKYIRDIAKGKYMVETIEGAHSLPMKKPREILAIIEKYGF